MPMSHLDVRKGDGGALLERGHWLEPDVADGVKCEGTEKGGAFLMEMEDP